MKIGNLDIAKGRCFIVAELSCNHVNDLEITYKTIKAAKEAGADALKVQTFTADLMTLDLEKGNFTISGGTLWDGIKLYDIYKSGALPLEWHQKISDFCKEIGILFFSAPFGRNLVPNFDPTDFLENLNVPCYKVASFEITDIPFIKHVASKKKPIIISTGVAMKEDIELAIKTCKEAENNDIIILKCLSDYPSKPENMNLNLIPKIEKDFGVMVGLSDHSLSYEPAIIAVSLGAVLLEKHFILDKSLKSHDAKFSLDPKDFKETVAAIRRTETALGSGNYDFGMKDAQKRYARSIYAISDIKKGEVFSIKNIGVIRPGDGLHPKYFDRLLTKTSPRDISKGEPLESNDI
jgi:pseudaminic acid synthase